MDLVVLVLITFVAATVNGALGYGFSSITVPVALLFYTNRILNPALVLVELVISHQWIRPLHQPQEHPEHLVASSAHLDRPSDRCCNRQLYSLPRSSVVGQVCDLRHAIAVDSAPGCWYQKTHPS